MGRKRLILGTLLCLACTSGVVQAHPHDTMSVETQMTIRSDAIDVRIRLTPPPAEADALLSRIDANGDGRVSEAERTAFGQSVLTYVIVKADAASVGLRLTDVTMPSGDSVRLGAGAITVAATGSMEAPAGEVGIKTAYRLDATHTVSAFAGDGIAIDAIDRSAPGLDLVAQIAVR